MSLTTSKTVLVLWVTVAFAAISLCASMRQDGKTSYSLEGAWLCQATFPGGLPPWAPTPSFSIWTLTHQIQPTPVGQGQYCALFTLGSSDQV